MIGKPVRSDRPHVTELTSDAIRHYAFGIGDRNPLWTDPDYAAAHGRTQLAPPSALLAMDKVFSGYVSGLPGIHAMYAGATFDFTRPLRVGDRLTGEATLAELIERPSRFAGRSWQQIYRVPFRDPDGELVCTGHSYCFRTERDSAREAKKYEEIRVEWSPEQIADIAQRYRDEEARRRGATPRYVEDVTVDEHLPAVTKGPYTATTAIAYLLGWGGLYVRAHGDAFDLFDRHPALGIPNEWGVPEPPERVHWDPDLARRVGVPGAYDYGPERVSWMGHVVTDWMGDDGFLQYLDVQVRRHNVLGELVTCDGRVTAVDTSTGTVEVSLYAVNQDGHESARGTARVVLPRRPAA
ncbi:Acyl dehydratase [Cryptosporangium aurantiacum]|uniref:Acyl dehydratase n=2 Tax=Cryptosporangium aurantiacum TaxID=134849 RepID=A0A1M7KHM8_9ACTN|nr:Acyl dehydratase [Cryptosporangium aurantiacum]